MEKMMVHRIRQENGPDLSYTNSNIIEQDGLYFKDLAGTGELLPYEDYRLSYRERAVDLAGRMNEEELTGLLMHSLHQSVPFVKTSLFSDTYDGKLFEEGGHSPSDIPDHQRDLVVRQHVRHLLQLDVSDPKTSAEWSNKLQMLCEGERLGIPVIISSDPRHGSSSSSAEFKSNDKGVSKWPEGLGLTATHSEETIRRFAQVASKELRAMGITNQLGPQIDLTTEPRWKRMEDTFGGKKEDVIRFAKAYLSAMQESDTETGWGKDSVIAMVKHFPGGGTGEGGRDAHYPFGKYNVYPGNNMEEHISVFADGAYNLDGKVKKAAATMPYYSVSYGTGKPVGNSYNSVIVKDILRDRLQYDEVICTDWDVAGDPFEEMDSFSSKCHGVEKLSRAERCLLLIENGIDQIAGDPDSDAIVGGVKLYKEKYGEERTLERLRESAVRSLTNMFRLGLFEDPYLDPEETVQIVGNQEFREEGFRAQCDSVVLLKNDNVLPLKKGIKVYIPDRDIKDHKGFSRETIAAHMETPVSKEEAEDFFELTDDPNEADVFFVWMESPLTDGGYNKLDRENGGTGYLPIPLCYRPYTAVNAREHSIAKGDYRENDCDRSYRDKTAGCANECDIDNVIELKKAYPDKPVIACVEVHNPFVPAEFEPYADALILHYGVEKRAVFTIVFGERGPSGRLPYPLPKDMDTIERHCEDVFDDYDHYVDSDGNEYSYGFGLKYKE